MKYTKQQIEKGFIDWITEVRLKPNDFKSDEECNDMDVDKLAALNAKTLTDYIKK